MISLLCYAQPSIMGPMSQAEDAMWLEHPGGCRMSPLVPPKNAPGQPASLAIARHLSRGRPEASPTLAPVSCKPVSGRLRPADPLLMIECIAGVRGSDPVATLRPALVRLAGSAAQATQI